MKPDIWGPHAWIFLHSITLEYPDNPSDIDKSNMSNFIRTVGEVLPCQKCRENFKKHIDEHPLTDTVLLSKKNLVKWLIDVHNSVNLMNNKKTVSYEDALRNMLNMYDGTQKNWMFIYISIALVIISVLVYLFNIFR
ncbi:ERV/ALR sulfhydryl oxidase [Fadolivirus algeromassiliense]|jgi:hypothetical protein|uniref:Sulfhydryl oxidase n=1 Tax=Fadolivirus FV1/VV64 TaxID=3070911 RepID=A0A7D3UQG6_9VIRU|nr:ERV/ALR sulfhydryl oxidase [Fadolivirus algeromassiliense]QKF93773.1 ERV/ALR sulfhydryl oxidase [Fadolivirus FV1/VV64]